MLSFVSSHPISSGSSHCTVILWLCYFYIPHISDSIQYSFFSVWFISLNIMSSRSIYIVASGRVSFLWLNNITLYMYVCIPHSLFSSVNRHLGCFYVLAIVNNNAVNTGVHISLWYTVSISFDISPEVKLLDHMIDQFSTLLRTPILFL